MDNKIVFFFATILTCLGLSELSAASQKISFTQRVAKVFV